jgi:predicted nucleic acid-binding protein
MIVVDTSIFIDLLFEYNSERTANADRFFGLLEKRKIPIFQPDIFRIEFIGQISRRIKR